MTTALIYGFLRYARVNREAGAASAEAERMKLAQLTSLITTRISRRLALNEVMRNTVEEIRQIYPDIYHAQIFLTEPSGLARLVASTGEVGGMTLVLHYDPDYLSAPEVGWDSALDGALKQSHVPTLGLVRLVFALPATTIPAGVQKLQ